MTVETLVRRPRKKPEWQGPRVRCAACGHEWTARKADGELRDRQGRRCPRCHARLPHSEDGSAGTSPA